MKQLLVVASFFTLVASHLATEERMLHYIGDEVSGGSYKYYSLLYEGIYKISLISVFGDADLYISQTNNNPTYEPDTYCLQSTTCGDDDITIPESFKRPVSIGVYGHPAHETSHFYLKVYEVILLDHEEDHIQTPAPRPENNQRSDKSAKKSAIFTFLFNLLMEFLQALL